MCKCTQVWLQGSSYFDVAKASVELQDDAGKDFGSLAAPSTRVTTLARF